MKKYTCPHCGFDSLINPGDRCPGCGYLFSYLSSHPQWDEKALRDAPQEIAIRRLKCAIVGQDEQKEGVLAECTITNRALRLELHSKYHGGRFVRRECRYAQPFELVLPYKWMADVSRGTHMGRPARFCTYRSERVGPLNLWFFVDSGVAARQEDIDGQVMQMVRSLLPEKEK